MLFMKANNNKHTYIHTQTDRHRHTQILHKCNFSFLLLVFLRYTLNDGLDESCNLFTHLIFGATEKCEDSVHKL